MLKFIINEGRKEDFKKKYSYKFDDSHLDQILELSDSLKNNHKYLMWMGEELPHYLHNSILFEKLHSLLVKYDKFSNGMEKKSIDEFSSIRELEDALDDFENRVRRTINKIDGADIVYEGDGFVVMAPLTHKASCYYGAGSKWCTASRDDDYQFNKHMKDGALFYILDTKAPTSNIFYKVALNKKFDGEETFWDSKDDSFGRGWIFGTETFKKMKNKINEYFNKKYAKEIEKYQDEMKRLEYERALEREEQRRLLEEKYQEIRENRESGLWDTEEGSDSIGKAAWAVLYYLRDESGIELQTEEEREELKNIYTQIDELLEVENPTEEHINKAGELEERKDELELKYDVYNLVEEGKHFELITFKVYPNVTGDETEEFAGGTYSELEESRKDQLRGDIEEDVMNYFQPWVIENNIDKEKLKSLLENSIRERIEESPEDYLDDDKKTLSDEQQEEIESLNNKIEKYDRQFLKLKAQLENITQKNSEKYKKIENKIRSIMLEKDYLENEIGFIKDDPQGDEYDYDENDIEEVLEEELEKLLNDPLETIKKEYININDVIDEDGIIEDVISSDGLGNLSGYDGTYNEYEIGGEDMIAMRTN